MTSNNRNQAIRAASERLGVPFDLALIRKAPGFEIPDVEGTVNGWRAWTVSKDPPAYGTTPKLQSVSESGYCWYPQQVAEAECHKDHAAADPRCSCGFYSAKSLEQLMKLGYARMHDYDPAKHIKVIGMVKCWGQYTEGSQGWRSQFAYPVLVFVPYVPKAAEIAKSIQQGFGCKVRLLNWMKPAASLDQVAIVSGQKDFERLNASGAQRHRGRRCRHKTLNLQGFLGCEPVQRDDGEWWVEVRWDVRPDDRKWMKVSSLVISKKEDHVAA